MYSFKTHFSSPSVSYINAPTAHVFNTTEGWTVCFHSGLFLKPVWCPRMFGWPLNGPIFPWQQTAVCESPYSWLMSLAMDLAALCYILRWKWHQWKSFGCFSKDVAIAHHLVAPRPPPTLPPHRSASGIGYTSKKTI